MGAAVHARPRDRREGCGARHGCLRLLRGRPGPRVRDVGMRLVPVLRLGRREPLQPPARPPGRRARQGRRPRRIPPRSLSAPARGDRRPRPRRGGAALRCGAHAVSRSSTETPAATRRKRRRDRRGRPRAHRGAALARADARARRRGRPPRVRAELALAAGAHAAIDGNGLDAAGVRRRPDPTGPRSCSTSSPSTRRCN